MARTGAIYRAISVDVKVRDGLTKVVFIVTACDANLRIRLILLDHDEEKLLV